MKVSTVFAPSGWLDFWTFGALVSFVQTLYRLLIGRELARNYIDRTTRRCNLRLGLESRQGLYGVFTNSLIWFFNSLHPRHSIGILLALVLTLYRQSIRRKLASKHINGTILSAICGLLWRPVKVCTVFASSGWFDFSNLHILGIHFRCYLH